MITVYSPIDEQPLGSYPITSPEMIAEQMAAARAAALIWGKLSVAERLTRLAPLTSLIMAELPHLTDSLVKVTGKVKTEVLFGEIYPVLELLRYYQQHAVAILAERRLSTSPITFSNTRAQITRHPYGVVAILSPWNFPWQLTLSPLLTALVSGNAVIFKTSELSVPVGELLLSLLQRLGLPDGLVQQCIGLASTGEQLIDNRPDLVFFTGGLQTGRAIMARAAQHPIPVILELGGNDAMLVFDDAPLARVCNAALYGAFSNSGQVCVAVERLYVQERLYPALLQHLQAAVQALQVGHGSAGDVGALTSLKQYAVLQAQYQDAIDKGAKASGPLTLNGRYLQPVLLWDVTHDMRVMQEESFGALLPIMVFSDEPQAIHYANHSAYGLNASIWSSDLRKAERIAKQLRVGNWAINEVIKNIGHPGLPFGGVNHSGFGRYHGAEGLRQFSYTVAGLTSFNQRDHEPNWFPYSEQRFQAMCGFMDTLFGDGSLWQRLKRNWPALQTMRQYSQFTPRQHWDNLLIKLGHKQDF